ncbi:type III secretion system inner membrane ring lipoprotein SctJ [Thalassospira sp.]|uniref:type III secretion system inner membrane ring lipoprotein SctJ n=1 Tax=Thalassospira sp. TaxID=1912094 RepID=UPI000C44EFE8|nr:type III secretion inner membrane ring lipoprotein SctJ [Thalassospira sp.]MBC05417.1 EscJ/YscJ/HrcJ family type III secretion inner membrane ring protein [Thalassospira sp.]|tara:strand:- start:16324 stop:17121 length:798 start_codon:yes stop_codon:yes gene_type:complete
MLRKLLISLFVSLALTACSEQVELVSGLQEDEANQILSVLLNTGIDAQKSPGAEGLVISVGSENVAEALGIMRAKGLPQQQFVKMGDVFKKEGLISSPLEEKVRYIYALSQELSETITQIDGVVTARVHVVLPSESTGLSAASDPASASVFIKHEPDSVVENVVPQIKRLVVNSISQLAYDNVSVILVPSAVIAASSTSDMRPVTRVMGFDVAVSSASDFSVTLIGLIVALCLSLIGVGVLAVLWKKPDLLNFRSSTASEPANAE